MIGVVLLISLILNAAWIGLVARRAARVGVAVALLVALMQLALLANMLRDLVPLPMGVDVAAIFWHTVVLPGVLLTSSVRVVMRRRWSTA